MRKHSLKCCPWAFPLKLLFIFIFVCNCVATIIEDIYLNSQNFCGKDFKVTPGESYIIKPDISADKNTNSFITCELTFNTLTHDRDDGSICISQIGSGSRIEDSNAELFIYDGYDDDDEKHKRIHHLEYFPDTIGSREDCTAKPHLYFFVRPKDTTRNVDVKKINLNFQVYDIENRDRKLYIDEKYCDGKFKLKNSWVQLGNRVPPSFDYDSIFRPCGLTFEKDPNAELDERDRRICFVFVPLSNLTCDPHWELSISTKMDLGRTFMKHNLTCSHPKAQTLHVWCGENTTDSYSIIMQQTNQSNPSDSREPLNMFHIIVTDYNGTVESLKREVKAVMSPSKGAEEASFNFMFIIIIVLVVVVVVIIVSLIIYKVRHTYQAVHNPGADKPAVVI